MPLTIKYMPTAIINTDPDLYMMFLYFIHPKFASLATSNSAGMVPMPKTTIKPIPDNTAVKAVCDSMPALAAAIKAV